MNIVELLATVRNCFEKENPKVLIPKTFSRQKMEVLKRATEEAELNTTGATLINLVKVWVRILSSKDDKSYKKCMKALKDVKNLPNVLLRRLQKTQGEGQLRFVVESPAGPSRLCRVPFYPIRSENAWSSRFLNIDSATPSRQSFGIEELGDDPIINIGPWFGSDGVTVFQNTIKMQSMQLSTQKVEFGAYRLIGMEINASFGSRYIGALRNLGTAATGTITNQNVVALPATADFTIGGDGGGPGIIIGAVSVRVVSTNGADETFTSAPPPAIGPNLFINQGVDRPTIAANLASKINAIVGFSAVQVGDICRVSQSEVGTVGNGQVAKSDNAGRVSDPVTFTGGVDNVTDGLLIQLQDSDGTVSTFEADFAGGGVAPGNIAFAIDNAIPAQTMANLAFAINAVPALDIQATHVIGSLVINVTQLTSGVAGNTAITSSIAGEIAPVGFAGGVGVAGLSLNLTNNLSPIAITVKELTVYNGNNILIVEDSESVSVSEFNVLEESKEMQFSYILNGLPLAANGQTAQPLSNENKENGYKFVGFRDQPIVDSNSQVFVKIDAFITNLPTWAVGAGAYPANTPLPKIPPVSLSINLVVDLLEDKVFGDSFAPSPASRAAANIKLSGQEIDGGRKIILSNSVAKKPRI